MEGKMLQHPVSSQFHCGKIWCFKKTFCQYTEDKTATMHKWNNFVGEGKVRIPVTLTTQSDNL
jgi:hypothetical protein